MIFTFKENVKTNNKDQKAIAGDVIKRKVVEATRRAANFYG